ncbi:MAG TPA: glycosyltransferase family 39 protein [Tepidisphaeraceae bacterium]|nr:glycosyltransferase family 39 protein [Tepidisphaeraceae bacterium]
MAKRVIRTQEPGAAYHDTLSLVEDKAGTDLSSGLGQRMPALGLLIVALLAAGLQFCYTNTRWNNPGYFDAEHRYIPAARQIRREGLSYLLRPESVENPPMSYLWPALFGANVTAIQIGQIVLLALGAALTADAGAKLIGKAGGWIAGIIYATSYQLIHYGSSALSEPLTTFFITLAFWFWIRGQGRSKGFGAAAGIALGLAALTRAVFAAAIGWLILAVLYQAVRRKRIVSLMTAALLMVVTVGTVMVKNYLCFDQFRIANGGGAVLYMGADLRWYGDQPVTWGAEYDTGRITGGKSHVSTQGDRMLTHAGIELLREHPWKELCLVPLKFYRFLIGQPDEHFFRCNDLLDEIKKFGSISAIELLLWFTIPLIAAHVLGLAGLIERSLYDSSVWLFPAAVVAAPLVAHSVLFSLPRFSAPLWAIFAVAAAAILTVPIRRHALVLFALMILAVAATLQVCFYYAVYPRLMVPESQMSNFTTQWSLPDFWSSTHDVVQIAGGDARRWKSVGNDPFFVIDLRPTIAIDGNMVAFVRFSLTRVAGMPRIETCQLFYAPRGKAFNEEHSVRFHALADGRMHLYQICPTLTGGWSGQQIGQLRLDMPDNLVGETAAVDNIVIAK